MRRFVALVALLVVAASPALAQKRPDLQPLADVPPPPPIVSPEDAALEEQVTIKKQKGETVEEHRINGHLYKVVVKPERGAPYTLIDQRGDGVFTTVVDTPAGPPVSVPMWVIGTF